MNNFNFSNWGNFIQTNAEKAVAAINEIKDNRASNNLFGEEDFCHRLLVTFEDDTPLTLKPSSFLLPVRNSVYSSSSPETLFISKTPQRLWKGLTKHIKNIKKVIDTKKFAYKFDTYEKKEQLLDNYEAIIVDDACYPKIPSLMKNFFLKRAPILIKIDEFNGPQVIEDAFSTVFQCAHVIFVDRFRSFKIRIGYNRLTPAQIAENAVDVIEALSSIFPRGFSHFVSIQLIRKYGQLVPIYMKTPVVTHHIPSKPFPGKIEFVTGWADGRKGPKVATKRLHDTGNSYTRVVKPIKCNRLFPRVHSDKSGRQIALAIRSSIPKKIKDTWTSNKKRRQKWSFVKPLVAPKK